MTTSLTFDEAVAQIERAEDYFELFGSAPHDPLVHVKQVYRRLVRLVHPDQHAESETQSRAEAAFKRLEALRKEAVTATTDGNYGKPAELVLWQTRTATHSVFREASGGDLCALYHARTQLNGEAEQRSICKVAKNPADRDLLTTEATALKRLRGPDMPKAQHVYFPQLLDSFEQGGKGEPRRQVNVLARLGGFYDLVTVGRAFPQGVPAVHVAWIWRRVLWALGHAHACGVVHGAVLPEHIMIWPEEHGVVLVDWCYASLADDDHSEFGPIKAIVAKRRDWYPQEVLAKRAPSPATDIAMAARCMVQLLGGDPLTGVCPAASVPRGFQAFFQGCLGQSQRSRPDDAFKLIEEFDAMLERLGAPFWPRTFRIFVMPLGVA